MGQPDSLEQPAKVIGIIAEYNPFHGGHKFQIEEAKKRTGADWCVAAMSGDFVQRGEPAVYSKYLRTRMALSCGADLVVELPSAFAVSSAEDFAACGVALLTGLGAVDVLCFGSEDGDIRRIRKADCCRYPGAGRRGLFLTSKHWTAKRPQLAPGPQPGPA